MSLCDLCGKERNLNVAIIESATLNVCEDCSKHGKVISKYKEPQKETKKVTVIEQPEETIVHNYHELLRSSREKMKMELKDVSQAMAVKESVIAKLETGSLPLDFKLAKRFELFYKIKLITKGEKYDYIPTRSESSSFTIGDILKKKLEK